VVWQEVEAAWQRCGSTSKGALHHWIATGVLGDPEAPNTTDASMLGAYLQLNGVPPSVVLQQAVQQVHDLLQKAQVPTVVAAAAAAATLASSAPGMQLSAAKALAAALVH
jgi:hypothetical protein